MENGSFERFDFEDCSLHVNLRKANLRHAAFLNVGIKTCDFIDSNLTNARFENVCIEGANFSGTIQLQNKPGADKVVVTVFSDSNKKYLSADLMKEEGVKEGYLSTDVELIDYKTCLNHNVSAEMHLYAKGGHGFGMYNEFIKDKWMDRLANWLEKFRCSS